MNIEPPLKALGLPTRIPVLRGHGAESPEALRGVRWGDWIVDAEIALQDLLNTVDRVVVIGHSMGGLVALTLAAEYAAVIDSIILAAAAVQLASPLAPGRPFHFLTSIMQRLYKNWNLLPVYVDPTLVQTHTNYLWVPTDAIVTLFEFIKVTRKRLPEVYLPTLIIQSHNDSAILPESVDIIRKGISTPENETEVKWFNQTEHEMFRDIEREEVVEVIVKYVKSRIESVDYHVDHRF